MVPIPSASRCAGGPSPGRGRWRRTLLTVLLVVATLSGGVPARAPMVRAEAWQWVRQHSDLLAKTLVSGTWQPVTDSTQNPDNAFLQLPRTRLEAELRPDLSLYGDRWQLLAQPRLVLDWQRCADGRCDGDVESDAEFFLNGWLARLRLAPGLYASYGRENLQWGPAALVSPSNPFFRDNGQNNPKREVRGMDFGRMVWVPDAAWSVSLIVNTDEGRQEFLRGHEPIWALKVDYTGWARYAGLVAAYRERDDRVHLGGFAGWNVSDAVSVYLDGSVTRGGDGLYPAPVAGLPPPFDLTLDTVRDDESDPLAFVLLGAGYTFASGPAVNLEYAFHGAGLDGDEADRYLTLRERASRGLFLGAPFADLSARVLSGTLDPGLRLLRRHYFMGQYRHTGIRDILSVVVRYSVNLDDRSSQLVPIVTCDVGPRSQLFLIGAQHFGDRQSEYRSLSLVDSLLILGVEVTF